MMQILSLVSVAESIAEDVDSLKHSVHMVTEQKQRNLLPRGSRHILSSKT